MSDPRAHTPTPAERYAIERMLGRGGMASVYLARDRVLERPVALKVLAAHLAGDEAFRRRFLREARLTARLVHPHIVQVYDVGEDERGPFIVTEHVDGETLAEELVRRRRLPPFEVVEVGLQLCSALEAAHAAGLVHRDVKPQNVLRRPDGRLKLADFGIARSLDASRLTEIGTVLGTAAYVAPEQARGEPVTPAADVYALGVLLFELLTGRTPFTAATLPELLGKREQTVPPSPGELVPGLPAELGDIVTACLALRPHERPTAAAVAVRLAASTAEAETEPPAGAATRATRVSAPTAPLRRTRPLHRRPVPAVLALLLALAGIATALVETAGGPSRPTADRSAGASTTTGATTAANTSTTEATTPAPPAVTSPDQALADARAAIGRAEASGRLDPKVADDLVHHLDGIGRSLTHPNPNGTAHQMDALLRRLDDRARAGRLTTAGLTDVAAPLRLLATLLPAAAGPPGHRRREHHRGEKD